MDLTKLKDNFPEADIEWRIAQSGIKDGRPWAKVLAYVTNRAIQERLDEVCGVENWKNEFKPWHTIEVKDKKGESSVIFSQLCGISIRINEEWITKWDGAECPDFEPIKGGLSNAMKRAGVQWGIGAYLYEVGESWAEFEREGKYNSEIWDKETKTSRWLKWNPPKLTFKEEPPPKDAMKLAPPSQQKPPATTAYPPDPDESQRADIIKWCNDMQASLPETLEKATAFKDKKTQEEVKGISDLNYLSGRRLEITHHKIHAIYKEWEKAHPSHSLFDVTDESEESTIRNVMFKVLNEMTAGNQVKAGKLFKTYTGHTQMSGLTRSELIDAYVEVLEKYNEWKKPLAFEKPKSLVNWDKVPETLSPDELKLKDNDGLFATDYGK